MDEKAQLIQRLDTARAKMHAVVQQLTTEKIIYPGWTPKHLLAHIAGWDEAIIAALRAYAESQEYEIPAFRGINEYNARSVETREMLTYSQVYREWEQAREQVKEELQKMSEEKFKSELLFPWGGRGSVTQLVEVFIEHETQHAKEIEQLLEGKTGQ